MSYGTQPQPLTPIRRIKGLSVALSIIVGIGGVVSAISGALAPSAADRATDFLEGRISEDEFLDGYGGLAFTQFATLAATIAALVLTVIWMYRISSNVRAFGRQTFWAPLWAVFSWVLPPILFVIPLLMLRELWKASAPEDFHGGDGWKREPESPILWLWWILFGVFPTVLAMVQFNTLFGGGGFGGDTQTLAENIEDAGSLSLLSGLVQLGAAVAWVLFVRQLTRRHIALTNER